MRVSFFEFVVSIIACAVWDYIRNPIEKALRAIYITLRTKKERRSPPQDRRSKPSDRD